MNIVEKWEIQVTQWDDCCTKHLIDSEETYTFAGNTKREAIEFIMPYLENTSFEQEKASEPRKYLESEEYSEDGEYAITVDDTTYTIKKCMFLEQDSKHYKLEFYPLSGS